MTMIDWSGARVVVIGGASGIGLALAQRAASRGAVVSLLCPGLVATHFYDAMTTRADRFGGAAPLPPEHQERASAFVTDKGQDPAVTAELCLGELDRDDFFIITDPEVGVSARRRIAEMEAALVVTEHRQPPANQMTEPGWIENDGSRRASLTAYLASLDITPVHLPRSVRIILEAALKGCAEARVTTAECAAIAGGGRAPPARWIGASRSVEC